MINTTEHALEYLDSNFNVVGLDEVNYSIDEMMSGQAITEAVANTIIQRMPNLNLPILKTLELANTSGNLTQKIINKYKNSCRKIIATIIVNSEDKRIVCQSIMDRLFDSFSDIKIYVLNGNFLELDLDKFNIIVGVPEISKVAGDQRKALAYTYNDDDLNNTFGFTLYKSLYLTKNFLSLTVPKYFLHNSELSNCRKCISNHDIDHIIDFGELAFRSMGIEFINIGVIPNIKTPTTKVFSLPLKKEYIQPQDLITSPNFPSWIIYINDSFVQIANNMQFDIFEVFRDRQISNSMLSKNKAIPVLKAKNLPRNSNSVLSTDDDVYIQEEILNGLAVAKFLNRDDVFLCPNMTPYPRLFKKPKGYIASGSLAFLIPKADIDLSDEDISYFSSFEFEQFYKIARNFGTRSLNLDKVAVFYFGRKKGSV